MSKISAQQLRQRIESQLANRIPSALTPAKRVVREVVSSGIREIDELTHGGFPLGAISEIVGNPSSGRTTLAMSLVSTATNSGNVCAWIDATNEFDSVSAAANGIALNQLLMIRCRNHDPKFNQIPTTTRAQDHKANSTQVGGFRSTHPRDEIRGLDQAVSNLLTRKLATPKLKPGTPAAPNHFFKKVERSEQVASDRQPARIAKSYYVVPTSASDQKVYTSKPAALRIVKHGSTISTYGQIELSVQATDLLLQHGGFHVLVLDLCSFYPSEILNIPLATWFRFRSLCEMHNCCLILLLQLSCAKSSAELSIKLDDFIIHSDSTVVRAMNYKAEVIRHRFSNDTSNVISLRKAPQRASSTRWTSQHNLA